MANTILDIIDTSVKIGLGALISGVSTYIISKTNHTNEKEKELLKRRLDTIENAINNSDEYYHSLRTLLTHIDGVMKTNPKDKTIKVNSKIYNFIRDADDILIEKKQKKNYAQAKLHLIGLDDAVNCLKEASELEDKIRIKVVFEKVLPTEEELKEWGTSFKQIKIDTYKALAKDYIS